MHTIVMVCDLVHWLLLRQMSEEDTRNLESSRLSDLFSLSVPLTL